LLVSTYDRLTSVPAKRDVPSESLARRRTALVEVVDRDLRRPERRPRRWLRNVLSLLFAVLALASAGFLAVDSRAAPTPVAVGVAAVSGSASVLGSLAAYRVAAPAPRQLQLCPR
jgi:hypothetical protein